MTRSWMAQRTFLVLGSIAVACVAFACSASDETAVDQTDEAHTVNAPTEFEQPWLWARETDEEFRTIGAGKNMAAFPPQHALVKRLQFWADTIDAKLRTKHGAKMKNIPRPTIVVSKDSEVNAFAHAMSICADIPVKT